MGICMLSPLHQNRKNKSSKSSDKKDPSIRLSVSTTTREPRTGEVNGKDYFFVNKEDFIDNKDNEFIEWAFVYGNFYILNPCQKQHK